MIPALRESEGRFVSQAVYEFGPEYILSVVLRPNIQEFEICTLFRAEETQLVGITGSDGFAYALTKNDIDCIIVKMISITGYHPVQI